MQLTVIFKRYIFEQPANVISLKSKEGLGLMRMHQHVRLDVFGDMLARPERLLLIWNALMSLDG